MSFCADDNPGFFETIQLYFTELTRRSLFLSGRDLDLLAEWREEGATATAVCKGLRDAVEAMPDDDPPRDVYACRDYIEPYVERARRRGVGRHDSSDATDSKEAPRTELDESEDGEETVFSRALERIERAGRRCDDDEITEMYRQAWRYVKELRDECEPSEAFEELAAVEEGLLDGYYRALDRGLREEIEARIADTEDALVERMSPEARRQHLRARRRRILIEEYDLISLIE